MALSQAFLGQRAESLAVMLLTRHRGIVIARSPVSLDSGFDLQVHITRSAKKTGRIFAVVVKARTRLDGLGRVVEGKCIKLRADLARDLLKSGKRMSDLQFPLLFICFSMDTDQAFFGWLRRPTSTGKLETSMPHLAAEWGDNTHKEVVREVEAWYKTRNRLNWAKLQAPKIADKAGGGS
jgi:hypothetical protein